MYNESYLLTTIADKIIHSNRHHSRETKRLITTDCRCYFCIGLSRYIAITNLPIIAVFVEYLRQFLIDLNQIYRHSSVPKNTSP